MGLPGSKHPKYERNGVSQLSQIILSQNSMLLSSYDYLQDFLVRKLFWLGSTTSGIISIYPPVYLFRLEVISSRKNEFIRLFLNKVDFGFSVCFGHSREHISQLVRYFLMNFDCHVPLIFIYNFCLKSGSNLCEEGPQKIQFLKRIKLNFSAEPCVLPTKKFISLSWKLETERDQFLKFRIEVFYNFHLQLGS